MKKSKELETFVSGFISEIIYANSDNHYTVCSVETEDDEIVVVGTLPYISAGVHASFTGRWSFHPTHGPQFKAESYDTSMPETRTEILRFLASGVIKGVRAATAAKIVDRFGDQTLNVMSDEPARLAEIKGISEEKSRKIGASYREQLGVRDVIMYLQKYSISPTYAITAYKKYGDNTVAVIKENPYVLAEEVHGIGFKTADTIAQSIGYDHNSEYRISAGLRYTLAEASQSGHTFLPRKILIERTCEFLDVSSAVADAAITSMVITKRLICDTSSEWQGVYLPYYRNAESGVAFKLGLLNKPVKQNPDLDERIAQVEISHGIHLADEQRQAVYTALTSGLLVITGGPGTGKTTVINTIIGVMELLNMDIALTAPTGRAAKRMTDVCGIEAKTIHRLLEFSPSEYNGAQSFGRNEDNQLNFDAIIVDEMSMVDILLMNALLKAVSKDTCLIMVGDADQLPPVGAGNVLHDIICSDKIPVVKLNTIFRQAEESMIVVNAHRINHGEMPHLNKKDCDFFFMHKESAEDIVNTILSLCKTRLPSAYGLNPHKQIQVLTPSRRSATGVQFLNEKLQSILNPPGPRKPEITSGNITFRLGDKVMQTKNNYNITFERSGGDTPGVGIFNGDIGFITSINKLDNTIQVLFDDERLATYEQDAILELELAYAMTIHKSQGSEFDTVVMPMYPTAPMLDNRNLLYTAVTRARSLVVLVGRERVMESMINNARGNERYSGLASII